MNRLAILFFLSLFYFAKAGNFTSGNIVVLRVGNGVSSLTSSAAPVFLDEYTRSGTLVQSIALPISSSGSNHTCTLSGIATSEGSLTLSVNGQYLVLAGYDAVPGMLSVASDSTVNRTVARVGTSGVVNTSTGIIAGSAYAMNNVRCAASVDGTSFWLAGDGEFDSGGTFYLPFGSFTSSPVKISNAPNNSRMVNIFGNQLYIASNTNAFNGVSTVGTGIPTTSGQTTTLLPGFVSPSSFSIFDFQFFDMDANVPGYDVLYFCDDRDVPPSGGIYKYSLVNGAWTYNGNVGVAHSIKGMAVERTCFTQIYCASGSRLYSLRDDNGYNQPISGTLSEIALAGSSKKFRGLAFAPGTIASTTFEANISSSTNASCFGANNGTINISVTGGTSPFSFNWGGGITTQNRTNLSAGTYTVTVSDSSGCNATASATITQPTQLTSNISKTDVSCFGANNGTITLSVSGGTPGYSYNWGGGVTSQNRTNLAVGSYTVTITDSKGCSATASATISQPAQLTVNASKTDVSCFGGNNGSITLSVNGGTPGYSYNWGGGVTNQNRSNLSSGNYGVTVTDTRGCTATSAVVISQPSAIVVTPTKADVNCNGGNNGSITLSVNGGTPSYSFNWSSGATSQNISGLTAGNYTVTISDAHGCTANSGATINQPAVLTASTTKVDITCTGANNGSIDLSVSGGTSPYSYNWSNGSTSQDINGLAAGNYLVTVTDSKGCSVSTSETIAQSVSISTSITKTDISCYGGNNGSIDLSVSGGMTAYSYNWSNGATTQDISGLIAGNYNVTVTDANGCSVITGTSIIQPSVLSASLTKVNISCFGGNNGSIDLTITGGTSPFTYSWSNGSTSQDLSGLMAGNFNVTVIDSKGCTVTSGASITQPALLSASISKTDVSCNGGSNGSITLTVSGGTSPYSYNWSNGATTQNLSGLTAGNFNVTVTDSKGCTASVGTTINQPSILTLSSTTINVSCNGGNNGSIDLTLTGGTSPYSYNWSNSATTQDLNGLAAGSYLVTVTDSKGCTVSDDISVAQPTIISSSINKTNITCNGAANGMIDLTVNGGTPNYIYHWSNGASSQDINGLNTGSYNVTITDANGCSATVGTTITQPAVLTSSLTKVNVSCNGGSNGSIDLTVSGGTSPYSYSWNNNATTQDINGLNENTYNVTITDFNNCSITSGTSISQPVALTASTSKVDISCYGGTNGSIDLNVSGGTLNYTYHWSNNTVTQDLNSLAAGTYVVTITDGNSCSITKSVNISEPTELMLVTAKTDVNCYGGIDGGINLSVSGATVPYTYHWSNGASTQNINSLSAGNFSVTVTDFKGCSKSASENITEPSAISITSLVTNASCNGGSDGVIDITVTGGSAPYTYSWNTGATIEDINNVTAGLYSITVTDNKNCTKNSNITVGEASALAINLIAKNDLSCNGGNNGSIDILASGGVLPYLYSWSNGDTTEDLTGLSTGSYTVTVIDSNNCRKVSNYTIDPPPVISASSTKTDVTCNGGNNGSITISLSGGNSPYSFNWSNGDTIQNISGLSADSYHVTVSDINGCSTTAHATIAQPVSLAASINKTDVSCFGGNNGSIDLSVSGGTVPYSYNWSNGSTTQDISNLISGMYSVNVTDKNGCTVSADVTISEPAGISLAITKLDVSCYGGNNGTMEVTASGGAPGYSYHWNNGETTNNLSSLSIGAYSVTVTDMHGCSSTAGDTIAQPSVLLAGATKKNVSCHGGSDGSIDLIVSGGTRPYRYTWSTNDTTEDISNLVFGFYSATITDFNGCSTNAGFVISQPSQLNVFKTKNEVSCNGVHDGSISLTVSGGLTPYSYTWSNGSVSSQINGLTPGTYSATIMDSKGCTLSVADTIHEAALLVATIGKEDVKCHDGSDGMINLGVSGGTMPYAYSWSNGSTANNLSGLSAGNYNVTINDAKSCSITSGATIVEPLALSVSASQTEVNCNGGNDGSALLTVAGGTPPYLYDWSNGLSSPTINGLTAGPYNVLVSDSNNCSATTSIIITEPDLLTVSLVKDDVTCYGGDDGSISLSVAGGTVPYAYNWSNGDSGKTASSLLAGNYSYTVTDKNNCSSTDGLALSQPADINVFANVTNQRCYGDSVGAIDITVAGGNTGYTYHWSTNDSTEDLSNLVAGNYTVTITDNKGCSKNFSANITQPDSLQIESFPTDINCHGSNDGAIAVAPSGGTPGYTYHWDNGSGSQNITMLAAGTYTVTMSDVNGCNIISSMTITEPEILNIVISGLDISCFGSADGTIDLSVEGGVSPYTYNWSNGSVDKDLTGLSPGSYLATITDSHFCSDTASAEIVEPDSIAVSADIVNASSFGADDGSISLSVSGGTPGYFYNWNNGSENSEVLNLNAGSYCITVTDDHSCYVSRCFEITEPVSIAEREIAENFNAYFTGENLILHARLKSESDCKVQLFDVQGRLLFDSSLGKVAELNTQIPAGEFASGMLLVNIVTEKGSLLLKVVVSR